MKAELTTDLIDTIIEEIQAQPFSTLENARTGRAIGEELRDIQYRLDCLILKLENEKSKQEKANA